MGPRLLRILRLTHEASERYTLLQIRIMILQQDYLLLGELTLESPVIYSQGYKQIYIDFLHSRWTVGVASDLLGQHDLLTGIMQFIRPEAYDVRSHMYLGNRVHIRGLEL